MITQKLDCNMQLQSLQSTCQSQRMRMLAAAMVSSMDFYLSHVILFNQTWFSEFKTGTCQVISCQGTQKIFLASQRGLSDDLPKDLEDRPLPHTTRRELMLFLHCVAVVPTLVRVPHCFISKGLRTFVDYGVDVAILEVGIGGRLDATNVIPPPVVAGITSLGFDHMDMLGNTLEVRSHRVRVHADNRQICERNCSVTRRATSFGCFWFLAAIYPTPLGWSIERTLLPDLYGAWTQTRQRKCHQTPLSSTWLRPWILVFIVPAVQTATAHPKIPNQCRGTESIHSAWRQTSRKGSCGR